MADTEFIKQEIAAFTLEYPAADGWKVYRIDPAGAQRFAPKIPAFLRDKIPGAFKESITTDFSYARPNKKKDAPRYRLTSLPRRPDGEGIDESDWSGDIEFIWKGSPFHVRRLWLASSGFGPTPPLTIFAVKQDDAFENFFKEGIKFVTVKSTMLKRSVYVVNGPNYDRPKVKWDDLVLPEEMKTQIRESFEAFLVSKKHYKKLGLPYRRGFLFVGPPGNGKTLVTKVIGGAYKVAMVTLTLKSDLEEKTVDEAFRIAKFNAPCVLILEDLDKIVNTGRVSLSYLLNKLDGMESTEGVLVIATTNEPQRLDPALLHRPSRFDRLWEFKLPEFKERLRLLQMRGAGYFSDTTLRHAAQQSHGFSMAYVQEAVVSALMLAVQRKIDPTDAHLDECVGQLRAQIKTATNGTNPIGAISWVGFTLNGEYGHGS